MSDGNGNGNGWMWKTVMASSLTLNVAAFLHLAITRHTVTEEDLEKHTAQMTAIVKSSIDAIDFPVAPHLAQILEHMKDGERHETDTQKRQRIRSILSDALDIRLSIIEQNQRMIMRRLDINGEKQ